MTAFIPLWNSVITRPEVLLLLWDVTLDKVTSARVVFVLADSEHSKTS